MAAADPTDALRLLYRLQHERPDHLPDFVELLYAIHESLRALDGQADLAALRPYGNHVLYLWSSAWPVLQSFDVLEEREDGELCECLAGALFWILSALLRLGVLPGRPPVPIVKIAAAEYGRDVLSNNYVTAGSTDALTLEQLDRLLYYLDKRWHTFTYGHHEVMELLFPALLARLLYLAEDADEDDVARAEMRLRRLWWPITVRGFFAVRPLAEAPGYDAELYRRLLGAVHAWVAEITAGNNAPVLSVWRKDMLRLEMPCLRELASRSRGSPRSVISDHVIKELTPPDRRRHMLDTICGDDTVQRIMAGPPSHLRQALVLQHIVEDAELSFGCDISDAFRSEAHLWDKAALQRIANSAAPYMLQMAGSYVTTANGYAYVSETVEEALAQLLLLEDTPLRRALLLRDFTPAAPQDDTRVRLFQPATNRILL